MSSTSQWLLPSSESVRKKNSVEKGFSWGICVCKKGKKNTNETWQEKDFSKAVHDYGKATLFSKKYTRLRRLKGPIENVSQVFLFCVWIITHCILKISFAHFCHDPNVRHFYPHTHKREFDVKRGSLSIDAAPYWQMCKAELNKQFLLIWQFLKLNTATFENISRQESMEYNFLNKVTDPKTKYLQLRVATILSWTNYWKRKIPRDPVNNIIKCNCDRPKNY